MNVRDHKVTVCGAGEFIGEALRQEHYDCGNWSRTCIVGDVREPLGLDDGPFSPTNRSVDFSESCVVANLKRNYNLTTLNGANRRTKHVALTNGNGPALLYFPRV